MTFRSYMCTIIFCCVQKSTSVFLQAIGSPVLSLSLSLLRDFVINVPAVLLLPRVFGLTGTLWSAPIADVISVIAAVIMMCHVWRGLSGEKMKEDRTAEQLDSLA